MEACGHRTLRDMRRLLLVVGIAVALFALVAAVLPRLVDVDRFRPQVEAMLSSQLGRPVKLAPLRLSLWTGVAVRTDRVEVGTLPTGGLVAGRVRLRPALLPLLRGNVELRAIEADDVTITRATGPLLNGGRLRARLARI